MDFSNASIKWYRKRKEIYNKKKKMFKLLMVFK